MSKGLWYNAEMFYYSLLWSSADKNGIHDKMSFGVIDSSLRVTIPFSIFLAKRSCLCLEWQESIRRYPKHSKESAAMMRGTLNVILNEREGSVLVVRKAVRRHPSHRFFTLCHCSVFYFSHKAFLPPFRMTTDGKRHPEWMWRIYDCGEENGKSLVGSYERNRVITPHHIDAFMFYRQRTCCKYNWEVPLNSGIFISVFRLCQAWAWHRKPPAMRVENKWLYQ